MSNETLPNKPTPQQIESHQFNLDMIDLEFDAALKSALLKIKDGTARAFYTFRDGIEDEHHLTHITITPDDNEILYDQDFMLEEMVRRAYSREDN